MAEIPTSKLFTAEHDVFYWVIYLQLVMNILQGNCLYLHILKANMLQHRLGEITGQFSHIHGTQGDAYLLATDYW